MNPSHPHPSRLEHLVEEIRGYVALHPAAELTVEGVTSWLLARAASATGDEVRHALSLMEARGDVALTRTGQDAKRDPRPAATGSVRLGIDLGGSKTEIIALDADGAVRLRRRSATPLENYEGILDQIVTLVRDAERELGLPPGSASVGVGTPGSVSRATGLLRGSNSLCLNGKPIRQALEQRLDRPVAIANDANCFALSEATDGAGRGARVVFGAIIGTGVGGGIVVDGRVLDGPNGIAGEWGHNPLPWPRDDERPGPACFCGRRGCIETFVSGPGLARDHGLVTGDQRAAHEIVAAAESGDAACEATLVRHEDRLARALAHVINLLDPDVIVLGGGLSNIDRLYRTIPQRWGSWVFSDRVDTRLVKHRHGDSSGVRGAAWLETVA